MLPVPGGRSSSRRISRNRFWIIFGALVIPLIITLVQIHLGVILSNGDHGESVVVRSGPSKNRYDAGVPSQNRTKIKLNGKMKMEDMPMEMDILIEDGPVYEAPIIYPNVRDFDSGINGVIVTKIQGSEREIDSARQMLCLLTKAYNNRVNHDIVVFTSEAINATQIESLQNIVHPAKLTVAVDNPGLHQMVDELSPARKKHLLDRCNVTKTSELSWRTKCWEEGSNQKTHEMIAYNWQAEFRSLWMWTHPLLAPYKYMMWVDSDAFCTRIWNQDPFAAMERHDLALLFDHFPMGQARGYEFPRLTKRVFDRVICSIKLVNGTLQAFDGKCQNRRKAMLPNVHGFFHVTSLDFFRSEPVMTWNKAMIGDTKFSRLFDDQIGITIPSAVLASNRSRDMAGMGIYPRVYHNYFLDGKGNNWRGNFKKWWEKNAETIFPEAIGQCEITTRS